MYKSQDLAQIEKMTADAVEGVASLIRLAGDDPAREGLRETPDRVVRAYKEMFAGYKVDIFSLFKVFDGEKYDQMVLLRDIPFTSTCEHHMLPFAGMAHVAYLPDRGRVVGVSKLARVVDAFARRLQIQERLTRDVANAIDEHLRPQGVGVVMRAEHLCMACRGVRKSGASMVTSALIGEFFQPEVRAEFFTLAGVR